MGAADDALRPFQNLAAAITREAGARGFHLEVFSVIPSLDGSPSYVQAVFSVNEDQLRRAPDQDQVDTVFFDLVERDREAAEQEKIETARRELQDLSESLKDPEKGIGL